MASIDDGRRLVVTADDFGRSASINQAVVRAHREGILTSASLMVNGDSFEEAVDLAKDNPNLGVGLHLTLMCGRPTLTAAEIPGLLARHDAFRDDPVRAGLGFFFRRGLTPQIQGEIAAQIRKFRQTGLTLDHVDGHLNVHLHPTVFRLLMEHAREGGFRTIRLTHESLRLSRRMTRGRWVYRLSHAAVFGLLSEHARPILLRKGIRHTDAVFGLLQNGCINEDYLSKLIPALPPGDSELYAHPSLDEFKHELDALVSPKVRRLVDEHRIKLIRYCDL